MKTLNPMNPQNMGTIPAEKFYTREEVDALLAGIKTVATTSKNGLMSADDKKRLDALSGGVDKIVTSATLVIPASKAASSTTVTLAAECDYVICNNCKIANNGSGAFDTYVEMTDGSFEYRTITLKFANKKTLTANYTALSYNMTKKNSYTVTGYKYLI